jgi:hypothetical protein
MAERRYKNAGEARQFFQALKAVGLIYPEDGCDELIEDMDAAGLIEDAVHPDLKDLDDEDLDDDDEIPEVKEDEPDEIDDEIEDLDDE